MKKLVWIMAVSLCHMVYSQVDVRDSIDISKHKKYYKYIGVQSNLLLQQFISFNSNSSINTNPYIFSYSKNNINTGNGVVWGSGFLVSESSSNDGVSAVNVQDINITLRNGYEKKYLQNQKFIPFWGIEFGAGFVKNRTASRLVQSTTSTEVVVETQTAFAGPALRGGLNYVLTKHILLGTEFYFNAMISNTRVNNGNQGFGGSSFAPFNVGFKAPTALFLIFRY